MNIYKRTLSIYYPIYIYQGKCLPFFMLDTFYLFPSDNIFSFDFSPIYSI